MTYELRHAVGTALALAALALPGVAIAQDWPTRPVTMVVPYAPGGNTDTMARLLAEGATQATGQQFIVENMPGAAGAIGTMEVVKARNDGYTFLFGAASQIIVLPLQQDVDYDPETDLTPVTIFGEAPYILAIRGDIPAQNIEEFIDYGRDHQGELNYGSAGVGGISHLFGALFATMAEVEMTHIPYQGGAPAVGALVSGEIDMYFGPGADLMQYANGDTVRLLAVSSPERTEALPDVQTLSSVFPGFDLVSWNGVLAPAGTDQAIVDRFAEISADAAAREDIVARLASGGVDAVGGTPAEFQAVIDLQRDLYVKAIAATEE